MRDRSRFRTPGSTHATRCVRVDFEDAVHLGRDDHDRIAERRRTTGEAGTAAACHERPLVPPRDAYRGRDLLGRPRPAHGQRRTLGNARVSRVQREFEWLGARSLRTDHGMQSVEE